MWAGVLNSRHRMAGCHDGSSSLGTGRTILSQTSMAGVRPLHRSATLDKSAVLLTKPGATKMQSVDITTCFVARHQAMWATWSDSSLSNRLLHRPDWGTWVSYSMLSCTCLWQRAWADARPFQPAVTPSQMSQCSNTHLTLLYIQQNVNLH